MPRRQRGWAGAARPLWRGEGLGDIVDTTLLGNVLGSRYGMAWLVRIVVLHVPSMAVWVGGLAGLVLVTLASDDSCRLAVVLPRWSRSAFDEETLEGTIVIR